MAENDAISCTKPPPPRPTISLPPRGSIEALFGAGSGLGLGLGASPGPMTIASTFFSDSDTGTDCRSFSQLLASAMSSPVAQRQPSTAAVADENSVGASSGGVDVDLSFKQNRPAGLVVAQPQSFTIPPGLSPASLLDSPGLFPGQGPFGMSHQQALAHVTAQAHSNMQIQDGFTSPSAIVPSSLAQFPSFPSKPSAQQDLVPNYSIGRPKEQTHFPESDERTQQSSSVGVDKPVDDGYNWRKYGQKQVKGTEFPRSYYKCTHPSCPVKKKVERSFDGHITEMIYKGQHNHQPPQSSKRSKDGESSSNQYQAENAARTSEGLGFPLSRRDQESSQAIGECWSSSKMKINGVDGDEDGGAMMQDGDEEKPEPKRRNLIAGVSEQATSHRTVTEPKIIVQTTSEVDLLDDGYRWRKYGQKVVKGNPYPRSYYRCTHPGCNVRKHIERASADPNAVITTYEGKHSHDVPAHRGGAYNTCDGPHPPPLRLPS